jgi:hypothetical protein
MSTSGGNGLLNSESFTDADFRRTIWNALRMVAIAVVVAAPLLWWRLGWQSAAFLAIGAAISGSSLYEWLRLMTAVTARMDSSAPPKRPLAGVLTTFFLRLLLAVAALYVSLKFLHGSVFALLAGLALGVAALAVEGLRQIRS